MSTSEWALRVEGLGHVYGPGGADAVPGTGPEFGRTVTYHDSCSGLRELGVKGQPRKLLKTVDGLELREMTDSNVCCGFGGTFCTKMPEISGKMASDKLDQALATGARILTGGDLGCLLNLAGRAQRRGDEIEVRHIAELLANDLDTAAIGQGE